MKIEDILSYVDHTLLSPAATWEEIRQICDDGMKYKVASVCIPADYVARASEYLAGRLPVCTVIGFPCGYATTAVKCAETADAVKNGASEIDMVINIGRLKDKDYDYVLNEIRAVKAACDGKLLKTDVLNTTAAAQFLMSRVIKQENVDAVYYDDIKINAFNIAPSGEKFSSLFEENTYIEYEYCGIGNPADFEGKDLTNKIALVKRGEINFDEKAQNAKNAGAVGIIIVNNSEEIISCDALVLPALGTILSEGTKLIEAEDKSLTYIGVKIDSVPSLSG